jgi:hypothetical protein
MAASFADFVKSLANFAGEARKIAEACTAARLHLPNV